MWGYAKTARIEATLRLSVVLFALVAAVSIACSDGNGTNDATLACNDGTGETNCCNQSAIDEGPCSSNGLMCMTRCSAEGFNVQVVCNGTTWSKGKGLRPCGAPK